MIRKYTKFIVFCLSVLTAETLGEIAGMLLDPGNTYKGIAIKMAITVMIYVPVFSFLDSYLQKASKQYAVKSKALAKNNYVGLTIGFIMALLLIYWIMVYVITGKNAIHLLF